MWLGMYILEKWKWVVVSDVHHKQGGSGDVVRNAHPRRVGECTSLKVGMEYKQH